VKNERLKLSRGRPPVRIAVLGFLLFTFHFSLFTSAAAQDDPPDLAPPPVKVVSREEMARLNAEAEDLKDRTKLVLELMNVRLASAEKLRAGEDFDGVFRELGYFHGLMDNGLDFLQKRNNGSGKILDNFKRLEIGLRSFVPRLELVRREVPLRYEDYIRKLIKVLRDARTKATEPLFSDKVVKTNSEK
jgi:hypothetical protein